jgi:hypothetical protein
MDDNKGMSDKIQCLYLGLEMVTLEDGHYLGLAWHVQDWNIIMLAIASEELLFLDP